MSKFPSPLEVTGVSYRIEVDNTTIPFAFPSPLEVTGVSYGSGITSSMLSPWVSVPSRGDWGVLRMILVEYR